MRNKLTLAIQLLEKTRSARERAALVMEEIGWTSEDGDEEALVDALRSKLILSGREKKAYEAVALRICGDEAEQILSVLEYMEGSGD